MKAVLSRKPRDGLQNLKQQQRGPKNLQQLKVQPKQNPPDRGLRRKLKQLPVRKQQQVVPKRPQPSLVQPRQDRLGPKPRRQKPNEQTSRSQQRAASKQPQPNRAQLNQQRLAKKQQLPLHLKRLKFKRIVERPPIANRQNRRLNQNGKRRNELRPPVVQLQLKLLSQRPLNDHPGLLLAQHTQQSQ